MSVQPPGLSPYFLPSDSNTPTPPPSLPFSSPQPIAPNTSQGQMAPFLVRQDQQAQTAVLQFHQAFYNHGKIHRTIVESAFITGLKTQPEYESYVNYLTMLAQELEIIEEGLATYDGIRLAPYFRKEAILQDLTSLQGTDELKTIRFSDHLTHLKTLKATSPYLLAAHAGVLYLGFLHGGQLQRQWIHKKWENVVRTYDYGTNHQEKRKELQGMLDTFGQSLTHDQQLTFKNEILKAYAFSADHVGKGSEVRQILQSDYTLQV